MPSYQLPGKNWPSHKALYGRFLMNTVNILKIRTPEKFAVISLKFEQGGFTLEYCVHTVEQSDQALHCLPRPVCHKNYGWFLMDNLALSIPYLFQ